MRRFDRGSLAAFVLTVKVLELVQFSLAFVHLISAYYQVASIYYVNLNTAGSVDERPRVALSVQSLLKHCVLWSLTVAVIQSQLRF